MADAAGRGRDVRSGGNAAGGACGGDVLTRAYGAKRGDQAAAQWLTKCYRAPPGAVTVIQNGCRW